MSNLFTAMNSLCLWLSRSKLAYEIILPYSHTLLEMRFRGTRQRIASTGTARPPTCLRKSASCPPREWGRLRRGSTPRTSLSSLSWVMTRNLMQSGRRGGWNDYRAAQPTLEHPARKPAIWLRSDDISLLTNSREAKERGSRCVILCASSSP